MTLNGVMTFDPCYLCGAELSVPALIPVDVRRRPRPSSLQQ